MNTKLTLSLNKEIIEEAKAYARSQGLSLSKVVEDVLQEIVQADIKNLPDEHNLHPYIEKTIWKSDKYEAQQTRL